MTDINQGATSATDTDTPTETATQDQKTFTQTDIDKIVADRLARQKSQLERKYEGVDVDKYQQLTQQEEDRRIEALRKREEFDTIIKETVTKKDSEIERLRGELHKTRVEGELLNTASQLRAINPSQVVELLRGQVRLSDAGEVEVVDPATNTPRYTDAGVPAQVKDVVQSFLDANPHFVNANSGGSGIENNVTTQQTSGEIDITKLDMKRAQDRELYKKYRNRK